MDDDGYYCRDSMCDGDHPYQGQTCADVEALLDAAEAAEHEETMKWVGQRTPDTWGAVP